MKMEFHTVSERIAQQIQDGDEEGSPRPIVTVPKLIEEARKNLKEYSDIATLQHDTQGSLIISSNDSTPSLSHDEDADGEQEEDDDQDSLVFSSVKFSTFYKMCEECFSTHISKEEEMEMVASKFVEMFTNASGSSSHQTALENYKALLKYGISNVVGQQKLSGMGANQKIRVSYDNIVTTVDESFLCLILQDRWKLWKRVAQERIQRLQEKVLWRHYDALIRDTKKNDPEQMATDDMKGVLKVQKKLVKLLKKNVEEEDFREVNPDNNMRHGENLTLFSSYGKFSDEGKTFNLPDTIRQDNLYAIELYKWRLESGEESKRMFTELQNWWGGVHKGSQSNKLKRDRNKRKVPQFSLFSGKKQAIEDMCKNTD